MKRVHALQMLQGPQEALALRKCQGSLLCCVIYNGAWLTFSLETLLLQTPKQPTVSAIQTSTNYGLNEADKLLQIAGSVCLLLHYLVSLDRCIFSSYGGQPMIGTHTHRDTKTTKKMNNTHAGLSTTGALCVIYRAQVHHLKGNFIFDLQNILPVCSGFSQNIKWDHLHLWSEWWHYMWNKRPSSG